MEGGQAFYFEIRLLLPIHLFSSTISNFSHESQNLQVWNIPRRWKSRSPGACLRVIACCSVERSYFYAPFKVKITFESVIILFIGPLNKQTDLQNSAWGWIVESRLHGRRLNIVGNYFGSREWMRIELRNVLAKMPCATLLNVFFCLLVTICAILKHSTWRPRLHNTSPLCLDNGGGSCHHFETKTNWDDRDADKDFELYGHWFEMAQKSLQAFLFFHHKAITDCLERLEIIYLRVNQVFFFYL